MSHKILLSNSVGIRENLSSNLKNISGKRVFLVCLPSLFEDIDRLPAITIVFDIVGGV
jgi:kynurenine formamidase